MRDFVPPKTPEAVHARDTSQLFRRRVLVAIVAVTTISMGTALGLGLFSDAFDPVTSAKADTFSRSAVGFWGLQRLLQHEGHDVRVSRADTRRRLGRDTALLLLGPPTEDLQALQDLVEAAMHRDSRVVVVLPKWIERVDRSRPRWISGVRPTSKEDVQAVLETVVDTHAGAYSGAILRLAPTAEAAPDALGLPEGVDLPQPQLLDTTIFGVLDAEVGPPGGALFARGGRLLVLSDPDLVDNAGLARGANASTFLAALRAHVGDRRLVIDEVLHGHEQRPSLWNALTDFPLVTLTLHLCGLLLLALWAAQQRFGAPEPVPPRLAPGKGALITNTAELLTAAGRGGDGLRRYFDLVIGLAARAAALPPNLDAPEILARLSRLSRARGLAHDPAELRGRVASVSPRAGDSRRVRLLAADIHEWLDALTGADHPTADRTRR